MLVVGILGGCSSPFVNGGGEGCCHSQGGVGQPSPCVDGGQGCWWVMVATRDCSECPLKLVGGSGGPLAPFNLGGVRQQSLFVNEPTWLLLAACCCVLVVLVQVHPEACRVASACGCSWALGMIR